MPEFDRKVPSIARVYHAGVGGKDNFSGERAIAMELYGLYPPVLSMIKDNRDFLARAVAWAAEQGTGQFIDFGPGMPSPPNTHDNAAAVDPEARTLYVELDPIAASHLAQLVAVPDSGVTAVRGDIREVPATLDVMRSTLDLRRPVCLVMGNLLHFWPAPEARALVAAYAAELAPGSHVVASISRGDTEVTERFMRRYAELVAPIWTHSVADFTSFFSPLELVAPGVVEAQHWRPGWGHIPPEPRHGQILVAVARVPG